MQSRCGGGGGRRCILREGSIPEIEPREISRLHFCRTGRFVTGYRGTVHGVGFVAGSRSAAVRAELFDCGAEIPRLEVSEEDVHAGDRGGDEGVVHFDFGVYGGANVCGCQTRQQSLSIPTKRQLT